MPPKAAEAKETRPTDCPTSPTKFEWVSFGEERFPKHARRHVMRGKSRLRKWAHLRNSERPKESLPWTKKQPHPEGQDEDSPAVEQLATPAPSDASLSDTAAVSEDGSARKRQSQSHDAHKPGLDTSAMVALSTVSKSSYPAEALGYTVADRAWATVKEVIFGIDSRTTFFPFTHVHAVQTMRDSCSFQSLLAYAAHKASNVDDETPQSHTQALVHKAAGMRLVNQRLTDPVRGTDDGTIEAVMFLAVMEARWGTAENCRPHFDGLLQILVLRGGFRSIANTRMETLMCWMNIAYPFHLGSGPYMPDVSSPSDAKDFGLLSQPLSHCGEGHPVDHVEISLPTARYLGACCNEIIMFLSSLRHIVHPDTFYDSISIHSAASEPVQSFLSTTFSPGGSLLRLLGHPIGGFPAYSSVSPKGTLYLTAVLFHVHAALQDFWDFPHLLVDHFQRLQRKILENGLHKGGGVEMVLWTVMDDCAGDFQDLPKRTWLVSRLIMIAKRLRPETRTRITSILLRALVAVEGSAGTTFDVRRDGEQITKDVWKGTTVRGATND